jgi:Mg-chelatase subunit ChlD
VALIDIAFDRPVWLLLLAVVPVVWWLSLRSLAGLGPVRRVVAIVLRSAVIVLLVLAAAELQWLQQSKRLTVIYLIDQSKSIPEAQRQEMLRYVNAEVAKHRRNDDRAGVIVFGRDAAVEVPPYDDAVQLSSQTGPSLNPDHTNLAGALKLAQASFPEDSSRRIVVISDGNENIGNAIEQAQLAVNAGTGIDVVPVAYPTRAEVAVEKVALPADVRKGQPFDLRVVVNNLTDAATGTGGVAHGKLVVSQKIDDRVVVLSEQTVELPPGKRVFTVRQQIDEPNFYSYEARFVPDEATDDAKSENNRAMAFTHVRGSGQVLLIEDQAGRGEHERLIQRLRQENLEVTVRTSDQAFAGLAELQPFDTVLLANVPREQFSDEQISALVHNTQDMGAGLVMLGGPNSFGAGGWTGTELEKALPVDLQIKSAKVVPRGALMIVMDTSGSMMGEKIQMSKAAAIAAVNVLNADDQIGVIAFDGAARWIAKLQSVANRNSVVHRISQISADGGTFMQPALEQGYRALLSADGAAVRHVIVLTDGQTSGTGYEKLAKEMLDRNITTTAVAVGDDSNQQLMRDIATMGGGKYYFVRNPQAIPRIFMQEARRISRPLIYENGNGFVPRVTYPHEMLNGIGDKLPPLTGYVMTTLKQSPLVEQAIASPVPDVAENSTILATWTFGLGRSVAFTSDVGLRWSREWNDWSNYDKFFSQMVRWSMRPAGNDGNYTVATDVKDGKVNVVITAFDAEDEAANFLDFGGAVLGPDMQRRSLELSQAAPGRYVGSFDADDSGNYFLTVGARGGAPLRIGVNVPYSPEFADRRPNELLLQRIADLPSSAGASGVVIHDPKGAGDLDALLATDTFRHDLPPSTRTSDVWPQLLWLAAAVFLADVFMRRVHIDFGDAWKFVLASSRKLLRRRAVAQPDPYLERLRSRKAEVAHNVERQQRTNIEFEMNTDAGELPAVTVVEAKPTSTAGTKPETSLTPQADEDTSHTSRLLKAKKKVWEKR